MVLEELGSKISNALAQMSSASVIDDAVLGECLKEIATALLQADVNVTNVARLRDNVKKKVKLDEVGAGLNKRKIIEKAVFDELCGMLDASGADASSSSSASSSAAKVKRYEPKKGKPNVVMFVGLQVNWWAEEEVLLATVVQQRLPGRGAGAARAALRAGRC